MEKQREMGLWRERERMREGEVVEREVERERDRELLWSESNGPQRPGDINSCGK
jgi:hypothetical protein